MRICITAALAIAVCGFSSAAFAHAHLSSSEPADGSSLTASPTRIALQFSEGLEPAFSHMIVSGPSGNPISLGDEIVGGPGDMELSSAPATPLQTGRYVIKWDVLSKDGHKTTGTTSFTVKP